MITLAWPRCICGHIAQAHNQDTGHVPDNYGCDECGCIGYVFPPSTPTETCEALTRQRRRVTPQITKTHFYRKNGRWTADIAIKQGDRIAVRRIRSYLRQLNQKT